MKNIPKHRYGEPLDKSFFKGAKPQPSNTDVECATPPSMNADFKFVYDKYDDLIYVMDTTQFSPTSGVSGQGKNRRG